MSTNQSEPCVFCGANTEEQRASSIGVIFVHTECFSDLEEILLITEEDIEEDKNRVGG